MSTHHFFVGVRLGRHLYRPIEAASDIEAWNKIEALYPRAIWITHTLRGLDDPEGPYLMRGQGSELEPDQLTLGLG